MQNSLNMVSWKLTMFRHIPCVGEMSLGMSLRLLVSPFNPEKNDMQVGFSQVLDVVTALGPQGFLLKSL